MLICVFHGYEIDVSFIFACGKMVEVLITHALSPCSEDTPINIFSTVPCLMTEEFSWLFDLFVCGLKFLGKVHLNRFL